MIAELSCREHFDATKARNYHTALLARGQGVSLNDAIRIAMHCKIALGELPTVHSRTQMSPAGSLQFYASTLRSSCRSRSTSSTGIAGSSESRLLAVPSGARQYVRVRGRNVLEQQDGDASHLSARRI